jgi:hypothetical protein
MTARYAHVDMDILREAVNRIVPKSVEQTSTNTDTGTILAFPVAQAV